MDSEYVYGPPPSHVEQESPAVGTAPMPPPPAPLHQWADHNCKFALEILDAAVLYQSRSSINDVPHVVLNKVAEYSDIPERIRLRQVNSTLRDGLPPTVPPRRCAFTDDAILNDCDAFWSKIAEIMAWFLIITHNRVKEYDTTLDPQKFPRVTFQIDNERNAEDDDIRTKYNILYQSFWWRNGVYTPIRMRDDDGRLRGIRVKQWMVDNHEDYYQGCVMSVINKWRKTLGTANVGLGSKGNFFASAITLSLSLSDNKDDMLHMDAIKYTSEVIAERLGRMYGLQIYYYRKPLTSHPNRSDWFTGQAGISIAGPGHGPVLRRLHRCSSVSSLGPLES